MYDRYTNTLVLSSRDSSNFGGCDIRCVGSNIDGHALRGSSHFANDAEPLRDPLTTHLHKTF